MSVSLPLRANMVELPEELARELRQIRLDRFSGNVELNILEGRFMGYHVKKVVKLLKPT